jgi:ribonuclease HI
MNYQNIAVLHVDGSLSEYIDNNGVNYKIAGLGAYLVINGKIKDKFFKSIKNIPYINHHEEYAIIESLKWAKQKGIDCVKIKTDSLYAVNLFTHQKKAIHKEDKFFLLQFMMLEYSFEFVEIEYYSRQEDDLSHTLSRNYLKELPKSFIKLNNVQQKLLHIQEKQQINVETNTKAVKKILCDSLFEITQLINR